MAKTPKYNSLQDLKTDLKIYQLQRKIAIEQLKSIKGNFKEETSFPRLWEQLFKHPALVIGAYRFFKRLI